MKRSMLLIFSVAIIALFAACDSGGGGGSERFSTVEVISSYESYAYTADSIVWEDTDGDTFCDAFGFTDDDAIATVTSTAYTPLPEGVIPSAVNILRYMVEYIPGHPIHRTSRPKESIIK